MVMKLTAFFLGGVVTAILVPLATASDFPLKATVRVDVGGATVPVNRLVFGGFIEHFHRQVYGGIFEPGSPLSDEKGFRKDVIAALRELRLPVVRWPGGCFVSAYHWKDGVGPHRRPGFDKAWGVEDPNAFGTDEFVAWCRLVGTEPYICGNAGTGTPEEMSDWVEYCNQEQGRWARLRAANGHSNPYHVRYWSIGNENYGDWEIGTKTVQEWGRFVPETAKMIRRVDPSTILLSAAIPDESWTKSLLTAAGHYLNMVSIHGYYDTLWTTDTPSSYAACMMRTVEPEGQIAATERIIEASGFKGRIGIAFDEWNLRGWHHPGLPVAFSPANIKARDRNDLPATYTMADAVFSACFLNTCLRHGDTVTMAAIAPIVNVRGPLYVHPKGIVKRTTFHVMAMYSNLLGTKTASAKLTSDPYVHGGGSAPALDAIATCNEMRRAWRIVLVNRHASRPIDCSVTLGQRPLNGTFRATVLVGDSPDACNDVDRPERVVPQNAELRFSNGDARLLPHSITILEVD
jgi:alpha-N-arabinofuranosidase